MGALRTALWCVGTPLVLAAAGVGTAWLWSDADTSLATTLAFAQQALPTGQRLETNGVTGSLRQGGHITRLYWKKDGLSVEAHDIALTWNWRALLDGALHIDRLSIGQLHINDQRPATPGPASPPPDDLRLPVQMDVQWLVGQLQWTGSTALTAKALSGHYVFDSYKHRLTGVQGQISSGNYAFGAELEATAPLRLTAQLDGNVATVLPGRKEPVDIAAHASVTGTLAGQNANLEIQAALVPPAATQRKSISQAMQA